MIDNFRRHRRICALVFLVLLPACHHWQVAATTPTLPQDVLSEKTRITRTDGSRTVFRSVRFSADTLVGFPDRPGFGQRVPLTDITRVETRQIAGFRTMLLGFVIVLPLAALVALAAFDPCPSGVYPFCNGLGR